MQWRNLVHFDPALTEMRVLANSVLQSPDCSFLNSGNRELRISYRMIYGMNIIHVPYDSYGIHTSTTGVFTKGQCLKLRFSVTRVTRRTAF